MRAYGLLYLWMRARERERGARSMLTNRYLRIHLSIPQPIMASFYIQGTNKSHASHSAYIPTKSLCLPPHIPILIYRHAVSISVPTLYR